jgi:hypothetical protein
MNKKPKIEIADIFRNTINNAGKLSMEQWKAANAIINCRTAFLGGHIVKCDKCIYEDQSYNSCRNRHCPKCQALARVIWVEQKSKDILPVKYFHIVFTLPDILNRLIYVNKTKLYNLLFEKAKETLTEAALNPENLGALTGFISILHTWGQTLTFHPHIHCVLPAGGLNKEHDKWISSRKKFFISVRKLSKLFQGKFLHSLKKMYNKNELELIGNAEFLKDKNEFQKLLNKLYGKKWVVYAKKPFAGPKQVFKYLARYVHRVAISNYRIIDYSDEKVTFSYKDYRDNKTKCMRLNNTEFVRRFLLHILPDRFMKIRSYGFLSNKTKRESLCLCRKLLNADIIKDTIDNSVSVGVDGLINIVEKYQHKCPVCKVGKLCMMDIIPPLYMSINNSS